MRRICRLATTPSRRGRRSAQAGQGGKLVPPCRRGVLSAAGHLLVSRAAPAAAGRQLQRRPSPPLPYLPTQQLRKLDAVLPRPRHPSVGPTRPGVLLLPRRRRHVRRRRPLLSRERPQRRRQLHLDRRPDPPPHDTPRSPYTPRAPPRRCGRRSSSTAGTRNAASSRARTIRCWRASTNAGCIRGPPGPSSSGPASAASAASSSSRSAVRAASRSSSSSC